VGERVNKIRFVGSINREARFRKSVTYQTFGRKREQRVKRREGERELRFLLSR